MLCMFCVAITIVVVTGDCSLGGFYAMPLGK
jgi:hypothetical protein